MIRPPRTAHRFDLVLERLERERLVEISLDDLADLGHEPSSDAVTRRRSPDRAGVEDLAMTLAAAERLPEHLTVRVVVPRGASTGTTLDEAQASMRRRAEALASDSWREAMAIRSMGRRQLPLGLGIGIGAALVAYVAAFFATVVDSGAARGGLVVVAAIALTVAWVVGWVVVEAYILDWRLPSRQASACELLAVADVVVIEDDTTDGIDHRAAGLAPG